MRIDGDATNPVGVCVNSRTVPEVVATAMFASATVDVGDADMTQVPSGIAAVCTAWTALTVCAYSVVESMLRICWLSDVKARS